MNPAMMNMMMGDPSMSMMQGYANWGGDGGGGEGGSAAEYAAWMAAAGYGADYQQQQSVEPMKLKYCVVIPRKQGLPMPATRERPDGCRTIFVGGVPEWVQQKVVRDLFEWCGEIESIRLESVT